MSQGSLFETRPRAVFSPCAEHATCEEACKGRKYRYELEWPTGERGKGMCLWCLANPSTATHIKPDPTVTRCIGYSRLWGYSSCGVVNARAWRETDPDLVPKGAQGVGVQNDYHVAEMVKRAELVVCGWGLLGGERGPVVLATIRLAGKVPHALALNDDGSPSHPLYLSKTLKPFPMTERAP